MRGSENTRRQLGTSPRNSILARCCKFGLLAVALPLSLTGCARIITGVNVNCPSEDAAVGQAVSITADLVIGGIGPDTPAFSVMVTTDNGSVTNADTLTPTVTPTASGTVTVTVTVQQLNAEGEPDGAPVTGTCEFNVSGIECTVATQADDCDPLGDGNFCTGDPVCNADTLLCELSGSPCAEGESCNEETDTCFTPCDDDTDCADELFCNGDETCNTTTGQCEAGTPVDCDDGLDCTDDSCTEGDDAAVCVNASNCDEGFTCNEEDGTCDCDSDASCDDGAFCNGTETCDADTGDCVDGTTVDCDDADACTTDTCDEDADACVNTAVTCDTGETCDPDSGECVPDESCVTAADCVLAGPCEEAACTDEVCVYTSTCDEGEVCDEDTETCVGCVSDDDCPAETPICTSGNLCVECIADDDCSDEQSCVSNTCVDALVFTTSEDNLSGTSGDDIFRAPFVFDGGSFNTLQTSDSADGLGGTDLLTVSFVETSGTTVPASLVGIETVKITDNSSGGAETLNLTNSSDITLIENLNSTQTVTIQSLPYISDLKVTNSDTGMTVDFESAATGGTSDEIDVTVMGTEGGTVTLDTNNGTNGFETVTVISSGDDANTLTALTETNGNSIETVNFGGSAEFTLTGALDATIDSLETVDAGDSAGGVNLLFGDTLNLTVTGGSGDDLFDFQTTFNSGASTKDVLDGGDGTDTLVVELNSSQTTAADIENTEIIRIEGDDDGNAESFTFNLTSVDGITDIELESQGATLTADTITLSQIPYTDSIDLRLRGDGTDANQLFDGIVFAFAGAGGSGDHDMDISFDNRTDENPAGTALTRVDGTTERTITVSQIGIDNIEDVTITNTNGNLTVTTFDASELENLVVTSSGDITLGTVDSTAVDTVNASGVTEDFTGNFGSSTAALTFTGATKDNTITTGSGADIITTGSGDDTISSGDGVDTITCGAGDDYVTTDSTTVTAADADTVSLGAGDDVIVVLSINTDSTNADVVTGFTGGSNNDQVEFDVSSLETNSALDASGADLITFGGGDVANGSTAVDLVECTSGGGACDVATATANVVVIVGGTIASTGDLETALEAGGDAELTIANTDSDVDDAFIVVWDDDTDAFIGACVATTETAVDTDFEAGDLTCFKLIELDGFGNVAASTFDASNFDFID